ncbi:hypothetical protein [Arthrobacter sp. ISL-28]|uniref:hypothetical protein n=1 Tax=Arthrobacter sp. ISL-28 TaxID=2819108 RepID=UPI001BECC64A|nr:hypothetical protein [Arthrobacter sp. ISL-28]MBT2520914.1 hypothetical protein [Arthrobacter sp. ISL-28]
MQEADTTQLAALEADARALEISLLAQAKAWALRQGAFARTFLLHEARLTVVNQAETTDRIADEVPCLKKEISAISDEVVSTFERWRESAGLEDARALAEDPRKTYLTLTKQAHDDFAKAFTQRGYNPGTKSSSYHMTANSDWFFYIPETGTARNPAMKYDQSAHSDLAELWHSLQGTIYKVQTTKEQNQRTRAASLWDVD